MFYIATLDLRILPFQYVNLKIEGNKRKTEK